MPRIFSIILALFCVNYDSVKASTYDEMSSICDSAAHIAAAESSIPVDVLLAITRTETGRSIQGVLTPWPWAVNMEGSGHWFSNREEAHKFVTNHQSDGAVSFDLGCFQISYRWHGEFFGSIEDMFEPLLNARYAAKFLLKLRFEFGSWSAAAGAFHSRTPSKAKTYAARFNKIRFDINSLSIKISLVTDTPRGLFSPRGTLTKPTVLVRPLAEGGSPRLGSLFPHIPTFVINENVVDIENQDS